MKADRLKPAVVACNADEIEKLGTVSVFCQ